MPGRIDQTRPFLPVNIALLTVSDTRTPETDSSGDLLAARITDAGHKLAARLILPDRHDLDFVLAGSMWSSPPAAQALPAAMSRPKPCAG